MIGLDTNVLVRYLTQDDPDQAARATTLLEGLDENAPGFVSIVTLVELHWVLRSAYKVSRQDAAKVFARLLDAQELVIAEHNAVRRVLSSLVGDIDFADALISELGQQAGCAYTATFDKRAAGLSAMHLIPD